MYIDMPFIAFLALFFTGMTAGMLFAMWVARIKRRKLLFMALKDIETADPKKLIQLPNTAAALRELSEKIQERRRKTQQARDRIAIALSAGEIRAWANKRDEAVYRLVDDIQTLIDVLDRNRLTDGVREPKTGDCRIQPIQPMGEINDGCFYPDHPS